MAGAGEENANDVFRNFLYERIAREYERVGHDELNAVAEPPNADLIQIKEIARQLALIGEELDKTERRRVSDLLQQLASQSSNTNRNTSTFVSAIQMFVQIIQSSVTFPASLIKSSIASLYLIWNNPNIAAAAAHEFTETFVEQTTAVPDEIKRIDVDAVQMYLNALKYGSEEVQHIRLMIIGQYSVGKTNLVCNLLGKDRTNIESTDGIDIHTTECKVTDDCEWMVNPLSFGETNFKDKLASVMSKGNEVQLCETDGRSTVMMTPDVETIYERCPTVETTSNSEVLVDTGGKSKEEELDKVTAILESFSEGGDPLLADYVKQVLEAVKLGPQAGPESSTSLSLWDFAGQYIYYTTHHFFMNTRSIYLLVMNISQPLDMVVEDTTGFAPAGSIEKGYTSLDAFMFWLKSIHTYSQLEKDKPCIIIVGTHKDKIPGTVEEKRQYAETYFNKALEVFINSPILKHIHPVKFLINNHSPEEDIKKLKLEIIKLAKSHSNWKETIPARWIQLERNIQVMKMEGKEIATLHEIIEADSRNEVPLNSLPELKLFLKFQHALGNLLYFDKETVENLIILSPQWIIDAFKCFVTQFPDKKPQDLHLWKDYEEMAILRPQLTDAIFAEKVYLEDYKEEIIKYMEQLDIMARPSVFEIEDDAESNKTQTSVELDEDETTLETTADATVDDQSCMLDTDVTNVPIADLDINEEENGTRDNKESSILLPVSSKQLDFHIVPCMLSARPSASKMQNLITPQNAQTSPTLCFAFQGRFLPPAVFHRLLAVCINTWSVSTSERKFLLFNGLTVFDITHTMTLTLWFQDHVIFAKLAQFSVKNKCLPPMKCKEVREIIEGALIGILGIYSKEKLLHDLPFDEYVHCGNEGDHMLGMLKVSELRENGEVKCTDHVPSHVVGAEIALSLWFPDEFSTHNKYRARLQDVPSDKELATLSACIGKEYWHVGTQLGIGQPILEQIQLQYRDNMKQLIFAIFMEWKRNKGTTATLAVLNDALTTAGTDAEFFHKVFMC